MAEIRTAHLLTLKLAVSGLQPIGDTPSGNRRIGLVAARTASPRSTCGSYCKQTTAPASA